MEELRREWSIVTASQAGWGGVDVWVSTIFVHGPCTDAGTPLVPGHRNQSRENSTLQESTILYKVVEKFGG